jgi:hypothetical protein
MAYLNKLLSLERVWALFLCSGIDTEKILTKSVSKLSLTITIFSLQKVLVVAIGLSLWNWGCMVLPHRIILYFPFD